MKKFNIIKVAICFCLLAWALLAADRIFFIKDGNQFSKHIAQLEFFVHVFTTMLVLRMHRRASSREKSVTFWFVITMYGVFFNDVVFYVITYYSDSFTVGVSTQAFVLTFVSWLIWALTGIIFLSKILLSYIYIFEKRSLITNLIPIIIINVVIIFLFFAAGHNGYATISLQSLIIVVNILIDLIIFDLSILCLICTDNRKFNSILSGFLFLVAGDIFASYTFFSQTTKFLSYGELLWFLGLIFLLIGLLSNNKAPLEKCFKNSRTIRSKLVFSAFSLSMFAFIVFFVIAYFFSMINEQVFISLPLFFILYSMVVIIVSILIGRKFEAPFRAIQNNIKTLMNNTDKENIEHNFSITEFIFLQDFIIEAFKTKEEQDAIRKKFGDMAASMVHDIASPIMVMQGAVSNLQNDEFVKNNNNLKLLQTSMQSVKGIAYNLLKRYRDSDVNGESFNGVQEDDSNLPRYIILSSLLEKIIANKNMELASTTGKITFDVNSSSISAWMYLSPLQISRTMSNLLNNAYESMDKSEQKIIVSLSVTDNNFILSIQDNGSGIPQDKIDEVLSGTSLKHPGQGLGLSGAKNYFESLGGTLQLESAQGVGTTIQAVFPVVNKPIWFEEKITYSNESIFLVLDDDQSIIALWCSVLPMADVDVKYFFSVSQFQEWHMDNKPDPRHVILLVDYNLHDEKFNGLDIIERYASSKAYLFTSHAEELWMQQLAEKKSIKLSPKSLIESITIVGA